MASNNPNALSRWVPRNAKSITALSVVLAFVNSVTMGYDSAMMNSLSILPQYENYFHLNTATIGLTNGALWMGSVLGAALIQPVSDRFGRKTALRAASCICLVGTIIQAAAQNMGMFVTGRILIGIGSELACGPGPSLIAETVKPAQRGPILGLYFTFFYAGSLISAAVNLGMINIPTTWAWRVPSILQAVPSLLSIAVLPFIPESARWLMAHGRTDEAREIIAIIHGSNDINSPTTEATLLDITLALKQEEINHPKHPWKELVASKGNQRRLVIIVSMGVMLQMMGNFVISYYLGSMLTQAGITSNTTQLQINTILSCWAFAIAVMGSFLTDVVGRRTMAMTGLVGMICSLYIFGGLAKEFGSGTNRSGVYGTISMIFLFQGFYAFSFTPLSTVYPTEILSFKIRTAGISLFRMLTSGFGLVASFAMSYAMADLGWKFYMINASWNVVYLVIVYFFWVETRRMPLEEIALKFGGLNAEGLIVGVAEEVRSNNREKSSGILKSSMN
ncbi:hexose transporter-like protein [Cadophora sp. DSE1049]|nr:hexose transporter-like protein [Cadophora sp. DSE1049]